MKQILLIIFLGASVSATAQILSLSFDDAASADAAGKPKPEDSRQGYRDRTDGT